MKPIVLLVVCCFAVAAHSQSRAEAEYYAAAYARHYRVPLPFVRSVIRQESGWQRCTTSAKGARGLMQLMPETARRLGVRDRCDMNQNISAGVRHLAHLMMVFKGDLRLVAAAYYAGEVPIARRGLDFANPDVVAYVSRLRRGMQREMEKIQNGKKSGLGEKP
jgi:soluble lytic murein transglycosylase